MKGNNPLYIFPIIAAFELWVDWLLGFIRPSSYQWEHYKSLLFVGQMDKQEKLIIQQVACELVKGSHFALFSPKWRIHFHWIAMCTAFSSPSNKNRTHSPSSLIKIWQFICFQIWCSRIEWKVLPPNAMNDLFNSKPLHSQLLMSEFQRISIQSCCI